MIELARNDLDVGMVAFNAEEMLSFYGEVLALPDAGSLKIPGIGRLHRYTVGTNLVKVLVPEQRPAEPHKAKFPWEAAGARYWTIHVRDLDAALGGLAAHGVEPVTGLVDTGRGIRYAIVMDPDGNGIEFVEGG